MSYFPFFIDLSDKSGLIIGGGMVAYRKVCALIEFGAKLKIVASRYCDELKEYTQDNECVQLYLRKFQEDDLENIDFCIAATDDHELNRKISQMCEKRHILVNVVDVKELCGFIFPSYVKKNDVVVGVSSGGKSPLITQEIRKMIEESLPKDIGDCADFLGEVRQTVKEYVEGEANRKSCYKELMQCYINYKKRPDDIVVMEVIKKYECQK